MIGEKQPVLTNMNELAAWLTKTQPSSAFVVARDAITPTKMHVVIVNGNEDFVGANALVLMEYLDAILGDDNKPVSRSERRRMARRR